MSIVITQPALFPAERKRRSLPFRWIARRALGAITVFWATATFTFGVQTLMPGNRAEMIINIASGTFAQASAAEIAAVNAKYGFDLPLSVQYLHYLRGLVHGV